MLRSQAGRFFCLDRFKPVSPEQKTHGPAVFFCRPFPLVKSPERFKMVLLYPPKTNIAHEKWGLSRWFSLQDGIFSGASRWWGYLWSFWDLCFAKTFETYRSLVSEGHIRCCKCDSPRRVMISKKNMATTMGLKKGLEVSLFLLSAFETRACTHTARVGWCK